VTSEMILFGLGLLVRHGQILARPARQPVHTAGTVSYEMGKGFQLDPAHCLLAASLDEQGGGDLCVGNDGFVFESLSDIRPENAFPLNRPDPDYRLRSGRGTAYLAKFPLSGGFVPLGALLPDGRTHPAAGTGLFASEGVTFNADRSSAGVGSEIVMEFMQTRWDGRSFRVTHRELTDSLLGHRLEGNTLGYFLADGESLLAPFTTTDGIVVFRFTFDAGRWHATEAGEAFRTRAPDGSGNPLTGPGELEPVLARRDTDYLVYTRGRDRIGRIYQSADGLHFELLFSHPNNPTPQSLNMGLDGSLYLATNAGRESWVRNPLLAFPLTGQAFGAPVVIHDEEGIRDLGGDKIPFVDHAVGANLHIEGNWRHLIFYRVCDLKERTLHSFQADIVERIHGKNGPIVKRPGSGLYLAEIEYRRVTHPPFRWLP